MLFAPFFQQNNHQQDITQSSATTVQNGYEKTQLEDRICGPDQHGERLDFSRTRRRELGLIIQCRLIGDGIWCHIDVLVRMRWHGEISVSKHGVDHTSWWSSRRRWSRCRCRRSDGCDGGRILSVRLLHWHRTRKQRCGVNRSNGLGRRLWFVLPAPFLLKFLEDECNTPPCLLVDFLEDLEHFFLLTSVGQALSGMGQGTNSYTSDSPASLISTKVGLTLVGNLLTYP